MRTTSVDTYQHELSQVIRKKAVGPRGSRQLQEDDLEIIIPALLDNEVNLVSKAVTVASVIILERNKLEDDLLETWKTWSCSLSGELISFFFGEPTSEFHYLVHKILRREDLNANEASTAVSYLLNDKIPDYQKGVFLIGERLKRESFEENSAFLQAMRQVITTRQVDVPVLIDLADPYDGFSRYPIYTPFVASLLASMGIPAYCHGLQKVAPKRGDTVHKILDLAGKNPNKSIASVAGDLENDAAGWGYLDQSVYFPAMHDLSELRDHIVKRPFLATLEKLLQPLRSEHTNHMVVGYVHSEYKQELADLLKDRDSLDGIFIVKGMEGSTQLDFRKASDDVVVQNGRIVSSEITGRDIPYPKEEWEGCNSLAEYTLDTGLAALKGEKNVAREILINQVVRIAGSLGIMEPAEALERGTEALDSGRTLQHWQNGCN